MGWHLPRIHTSATGSPAMNEISYAPPRGMCDFYPEVKRRGEKAFDLAPVADAAQRIREKLTQS